MLIDICDTEMIHNYKESIRKVIESHTMNDKEIEV